VTQNTVTFLRTLSLHLWNWKCIRHDRCRAPCAMAEVINGIYPIEQVQNECRSGLQHFELGLPRMWRKNGRPR